MSELISKKYFESVKEAAKELFDMTRPTDTWESHAAKVIHKHLNWLALKRIKESCLDTENEKKESGDE